ncbi:NAD-dependent epimerase/dehydratase family protein [Limnothrix sp. FACHB-708]|uniref:NAD-dependent epimerase/dehydratase family protein n=1 Tax=unclassified Limnothrix TaxID=2632864 RepID=UPI001688DD20|nr:MULTISPECIES: NAD-dependent epimerase/dehydratase family protein [unclassified Limnothrix]MBD2552243.1 NAD-dependent epimerase/dehydratase family protein [Limnothrix sp. FACHB-708]MBD2592097.1 NAD-dependent epimerase/dehydratase family protein [Limnothrix sp. FACHB-406]
MEKALILGGAGFIGGNLARSLVKQGANPRIYTRPTMSLSRIKDISHRLDIVYGDFLDDVALAQALQGVETVFHLISTTFPSHTQKSGVYDLLSNLLPTIRLVELCVDAGVKKIVYASSGGTIYGEPQFTPITEDHPCIPKSAYGQSKLTIENYLKFYERTTPITFNILRISNPFGPGQHSWRTQGIVAVTIGCILENRTLRVYDQGYAIRDYIFIDDVVDALVLAAKSPYSSTVNISSAQGYQTIEIINKLEEISSTVVDKEFVQGREDDVKVNILSNHEAYEIYNWKPRVSLDHGLLQTFNAAKDQYSIS